MFSPPEMIMSTDLVRYSVTDQIAEIVLDRAPVNALSIPLIDALLAALAKARDDDAVRAVIISSAHKVFCAGLDLDIVRGKPAIETKTFLERLYFALNDTQYRMVSAPTTLCGIWSRNRNQFAMPSSSAILRSPSAFAISAFVVEVI